MKNLLTIIILSCCTVHAQVPVHIKGFDKNARTAATYANNKVVVNWPVNRSDHGRMVLDLSNDKPLFESISIQHNGVASTIAESIDAIFLLTTGKRDLVSQNGWNIFFDKVPLKPFSTHTLQLNKNAVDVIRIGTRTTLSIGEFTSPLFNGKLVITLYEGSPLFNIAAVVSTVKDSVAILFDAGLVSKKMPWQKIGWANVFDTFKTKQPNLHDTAVNEAVKYRTVIGSSKEGSLAMFPAPHQYFYPLDEAFNLKFVWHGNHYRQMVDGYGMGIRQDLYGDNRFVPWFNAPPGTEQRLNFFCLIGTGDPASVLAEVKKFTHNDTYASLPGYKKMSSHFHNEFVMKDILAGKSIPDTPGFVKVFNATGIDIVHLAEFHYTAHPKGPGVQRLNELKALFDMCRQYSNDRFLLLPGEEPNEFFGGHWLQLFPKPVYWIMSRQAGESFVTNDTAYGTVYHVGDSKEMLELLNKEKGIAWTAHPRTKGSTGFPDKYKGESFFRSDRFLGAAWKAMPADLSQPRLGKRVLDLMDDMNNWNAGKKVIAEADLFTIEPENEMYAHLNVNYIKLDKLPLYKDGWQPLIDAMQQGRFFSTTGEVLIPSFTVNSKSTGDTVLLGKNNATISFTVNWTFPLQFAELISGDGTNVFRHKINLDSTVAFGEKTYKLPLDLAGRKWVRLEVWDVAANGAFTQTIYLE